MSVFRISLVLCFSQITNVVSQDYDVSDIRCTLNGEGAARRSGVVVGVGGEVGAGAAVESIEAHLRRPEGFKGAPLFADDRAVDPQLDAECQIRQDPADITGLAYKLLVTNFARCGVLKRNGFVHVRVWFPQFPGVVMMSDQELIIMCKPPEPTIIENKAAGFAGSFPHGARVSGVVEETPGRLEYEVALYKEAPPRTHHHNATPGAELPVDQAVPIGTKLQLRARINPHSAWKHLKLMEVSVSPDPDDPHVAGSVALVKGGCRNRDFVAIIPHQPARYRDRHNEVFLDFEAFLLSTMKERSTLWIHSQIKACMDIADCQAEYCLDLFEPSGQGRKRRAIDNIIDNHNSTQFTKFKENIKYTVLMPGDIYHDSDRAAESSCGAFVAVAGTLGCLLTASAFLVCCLASRLQSAVTASTNALSIDRLVREHSFKNSIGSASEIMTYTGRPVMQ